MIVYKLQIGTASLPIYFKTHCEAQKAAWSLFRDSLAIEYKALNEDRYCSVIKIQKGTFQYTISAEEALSEEEFKALGKPSD